MKAGARVNKIFCHGMCGLLIVLIASACATRHPEEKTALLISYPEPRPDSVPLVFLPGIVSTDSFDFNAAFSPDGRAFYFTRKINGQSKIYVSHHNSEAWTSPVPAPFTASGYAEADPVFSSDGKLYFISNRPKDASDTLADYDIWFVSPRPGGAWSAPEYMQAVNSDSSEFYISFAQNGNLYFASSRAGGSGQEDIYVSRWINERYATPENLGPSINSEKSEYDPCISAGEDLIVFTSSGRPDTFGAGDLYRARLDGNKRWQPASNLGKKFNTETREFCAYFSPDSKYFFFSSQGDVKWVEAGSLRQRE